MGSIGGLIGTAGGAGGTGFAGPSQASIQTPVTTSQANAVYGGVQNSMQSQQALLQALQAQQGLQNQSNVYGQLQGVVNGTGPNPAQAMLNQSTGQNIASQAALQAGQRGAASNVGLIARQAAQQGAATQQQSVGQAAALQAQQSLNALGAAGNLATTQAGQQIGQTNANTSAQQAEQSNLLNSIAGVNSANVGSQSSVNAANAALANTQLQGQQAVIGGLLNSAGGVSSLMGANGGMVRKMADGGGVSSGAYVNPSGPQSLFGQFVNGVTPAPAPSITPVQVSSDPSAQILEKGVSSAAGNSKSGSSGGGSMDGMSMAGGPGDLMDSAGGSSAGAGLGGDLGLLALAANGGMASKRGMVDVLLSPGEIKLTPKQVQQVRNGADPMQVGEKIKGKLAVGGAVNSYANDNVKKKVPEGTVIVPRSETKSKAPSRNSKQFVDAVIAKRKVCR